MKFRMPMSMNSIALKSPDVAAESLLARLGKIHPAFLQLVALAPVIWWFGKRLDDGGDEPLGLLAMGFALMLGWRDRASLYAGPWARVFGALLLLLSVMMVGSVPPMIRAGVAFSGMALCYGVYRRGGLLGLLFLALPVSASLQFYLGYPLRVMAAEGTVRLLELFSVTVVRDGTQVELAGQVVGVDPACSGVRMLWHALVAAMALAAVHRLSWRATVIGGLLAVALVIPANILRAAILVVVETGRFPGLLLGHGTIGLLAFGVVLGPLWWAISSRARRAIPEGYRDRAGRLEICLLAFAAVLAPVMMLASPVHEAVSPGPVKRPELFSFRGLALPLRPLPPTAEESAFASSFPGTLGNYEMGAGQVILRQVTRATRKLHPSRDCLRAAGYETTEAVTVTLEDGTRWARFRATRDGVGKTVYERVRSLRNGASWTDVSGWYWAALGQPLNGPWQAETVIGE